MKIGFEGKVWEPWLLAKDVKPNWEAEAKVLDMEQRKTEKGEPWPVLMLDIDNKVLWVSGWAMRAKLKTDSKLEKGDIIVMRRISDKAFLYAKVPSITEEAV